MLALKNASLLKAADQALYKAKEAGRNRIQVASNEIPSSRCRHRRGPSKRVLQRPRSFFQHLDGNRADAPINLTAPAFERGTGLYSMIIGNGTFAMNNNDSNATAWISLLKASAHRPHRSDHCPEPGSVALLGLAGLAAIRKRKQA